MDFFERSGQFAIGSRMRLLSERLLHDAGHLNKIYGSGLKPRWFPVFYLLLEDGQGTVTDLAQSTGQSHPAVVKTVTEMVKAGLVKRTPHPTDGRSSLIVLTPSGKQTAASTREIIPDINKAVAGIAAEGQHNLWAALEEWEAALERNSLLRRTLSVRKARIGKNVRIIPYDSSKHKQAWHDINEAWISQYFIMEEVDHAVLRDPEGYLINTGGHILMAEFEGQAVGACGLLKMDHPEYDFELTKMGVTPQAQGLGIGYLLGIAALYKAREAGARCVYLETNDALGPAISLYRKLGFEDVEGRDSPYDRCNVKMAIKI
ncbi:MAG: bifunctional helix-turn-helix transcriptional regulator/GNAT family N-acetyltransferase [Bacteroidota bacterium]